MNSFWGSIYDAVKDRRYGALFFGTLLGMIAFFFVILVLCVMTNGTSLQDYFTTAIIAMVLFFFGTGWWSLRQARKFRVGKAETGKLSCDELSKARSKLMRARNKR
jgi:cytosine/uracil/thiamine/allantoin permease